MTTLLPHQSLLPYLRQLARTPHPPPTPPHRVRVVLLRVYAAIADDELKGVVHEAAVAAIVPHTVAVNQHLLTQRLQLAGSNGAGPLHSTSGAEGPAGAAQQLVLDLRGEGGATLSTAPQCFI